MNTQRLKIAIQKSGRLAERSLRLLENSGLQFARSKDKLFWFGRNLPVDLLLVRDDDIPRLLLEGVCELGIVGSNVICEKFIEFGADAPNELAALDFGYCELTLAVPENSAIQRLADVDGHRIATSYPMLTQRFLNQHALQADIVRLNGAVEIAPGLGTADCIVDLVSTGTTLRANHLIPLQVVMTSQAALYRTPQALNTPREALLAKLLQRIEGVLQAAESKYVMLHAPSTRLDEIHRILPGAESPTVLPLDGASGRVAVHAVCREGVFWEHLEALKAAGASSILVLPVEKMLA